ncbi:hypothetical protein VTN31DRAFT_5268 [Thermomyces dupontii]|uniref:uncharacterized protein n=1 Tax=Talaromyces thermophilus TaxID=28565 RepID=UPI0037434B43
MAPSAEGQDVISVASGLTGVASLAVILRIAARLRRRARFGIDDGLSVGAWLVLLGILALVVQWCQNAGMGYHRKELDESMIQRFWKFLLAAQIVSFTLNALFKTSIVYLYLRHFGQSLVFRPIAFGVGSLIAAWAAGVIVAACLQCYPLTAFWDHSVTDAQCIDQKSFMVVDQAFCVAINLAIMALPIPMLIRRRLSWQDKLGLVVVYAAGIFVCVAGIYHLMLMRSADLEELTYDAYKVVLWAHIESSMGIVCGCLPVIRDLFPSNVFPRSRPVSQKPSRDSETLILSPKPIHPAHKGFHGNDTLTDFTKVDDPDKAASVRSDSIARPRSARATTNLEGTPVRTDFHLRWDGPLSNGRPSTRDGPVRTPSAARTPSPIQTPSPPRTPSPVLRTPSPVSPLGSIRSLPDSRPPSPV